METFRTTLLLFASLWLLSACSHQQQDALLASATELARSSAELTLHAAHTLDVDMHYLERPGDGPTVLLVHGFSANKDTWLRFVRYLPEHYHIIIPDLAGHGDTPAADSHDLRRQAQRLHALAEALNISAWHMAGNSMGGAIVALYAVTYPQHVLSLALLDAAGVEAPNISPFFVALEQGQNPLIASDEESFERRWHMTMSQPPLLPWPLRPALIRKTLARESLNRRIFADMMATREALQQHQFEQQVRQVIRMPTLIMWGEEDQVLDVSSVTVFKDLIPHAQTIIYPGIGHLPMVEAPKKSAADYVSFLQAAADATPQG